MWTVDDHLEREATEATKYVTLTVNERKRGRETNQRQTDRKKERKKERETE